MEFDEGDAHDYVVAGIVDSAVFDDNDGKAGDLYYLVHWEVYLDSENTWEPYERVSHLRRMLGKFHKNHPNKPTAESMAVGRRPQRRARKGRRRIHCIAANGSTLFFIFLPQEGRFLWF